MGGMERPQPETLGQQIVCDGSQATMWKLGDDEAGKAFMIAQAEMIIHHFIGNNFL